MKRSYSSQQHGLHRKLEIQGVPQKDDETGGFRFTRIFGQLPAFVVKQSAADAIGAKMTSQADRRDSNIPAGYTYFGQFVDHDITLDRTELERDNQNTDTIEQTPIEDLFQARSPSLDLDSVYGNRLDNVITPRQEDGVRFQLGITSTEGAIGQGHVDKTLPYDLPRHFQSDSGDARVLIPDARNDENLAVGQMHLLWLRFHNHVAEALGNYSTRGEELFAKTRDLVTRHYQYIVLHDFLRRIVAPDVYQRVILEGKSKYFTATCAEIPAMPLEFSVAAYRFGHSLVRETYDWNVNFSEGGQFPPANFGPADNQTRSLSLFSFTSNAALQRRSLPTNWIIDWRHFFDLRGTTTGVTIAPQMTKAIDPFLSIGMKEIPHIIPNLAAANLRRSGMRGLPSGQDVSRAMRDVSMLKPTEIVKNIAESDAEFAQMLKDMEFTKKAPLWFYILQEANARHDGQHLGEMGSVIVAETFAALVKASRTSILCDGWHPASDSILKTNDGKPIDSLPQLIAWIEEREPIVNPLEDPRLR
ncbi:MAG: heme peroxidase family protein [Chloroflexota bacterium]